MVQVLEPIVVPDLLNRIEELVNEKGLSYIDAIVHLNERFGVDMQMMAEIIKRCPGMRAKIKIEATKLNFIR